MMFTTDTIPIIDSCGNQISEIRLKEKIHPAPRRRCGISASGLWYKGAGIIYTGHYANDLKQGMKLVNETGVIYEKYNVVYPSLYRRFGIFTFPHQPVFSDCEGGCGKKESTLPEMQKHFRYSAIEEIVDVVETPLENHAIYVYRLKNLKGSLQDCLNLIEYILCEDFNTAWDKNILDDIVCFGFVRDLADWFVSRDFSHKLGTIYGLLCALIKKDKYLYEAVVRELTNLEQLGDHHIIYIAALIIRRFVPDCVLPIDLDDINRDNYTFLWEALYSGRACSHLENEA